MWDVEYTDQFDDWYQTLTAEDQDAVIARVELLELAGPGLGRPAVDNVRQSRHPNMKELRVERAMRVLFAFDPRRAAILLIGGDKVLRIREALTGMIGTTATRLSPTISTTHISTSFDRKDSPDATRQEIQHATRRGASGP